MTAFEDLVSMYSEEVLVAFAACFGRGVWDSKRNRDQAVKYFKVSFRGSYGGPAESRTRIDWVTERLIDSGELADHLVPYFDCKAYARDLERSGDIIFYDGYVFYPF